jgi:hypothetical protein
LISSIPPNVVQAAEKSSSILNVATDPGRWDCRSVQNGIDCTPPFPRGFQAGLEKSKRKKQALEELQEQLEALGKQKKREAA